MSRLDTFECDECGRSFRAHPDANAGENSYCSPSCQTTGRGFT